MSVTTMGAISCLHALKIRNAFIHGLTPVVFSVVFDNVICQFDFIYIEISFYVESDKYKKLILS